MCLCGRMLRKDKEEVEAIKHAKALEAEKAMYSVWAEAFQLFFSPIKLFVFEIRIGYTGLLLCIHQGRRSRRQRREFREKYMKGRQISPPR